MKPPMNPIDELWLMLAQMQKAYSDGKHSHQCSNKACDLVWEHPDKTLLSDKATFEAAHHCPRCGSPAVESKDVDAYEHYRGPRQPDCAWTGVSQ